MDEEGRKERQGGETLSSSIVGAGNCNVTLLTRLLSYKVTGRYQG